MNQSVILLRSNREQLKNKMREVIKMIDFDNRYNDYEMTTVERYMTREAKYYKRDIWVATLEWVDGKYLLSNRWGDEEEIENVATFEEAKVKAFASVVEEFDRY
jgi:hypothetical protein